jgi:L-ascorbate metabolism protein UlaG (beta-lactamase superfamily)
MRGKVIAKGIGLALAMIVGMGIYSMAQVSEDSLLEGLRWLGHASFRLERGGRVIYFDPWQISGEPHDADLVLVSHPHFDHCSYPDIERVAKRTTVVVTVQDCAKELEGKARALAEPAWTIRTMAPQQSETVAGIRVETVPAYNTNKTFHKKESGWVGFVVEVDGVRFYHAGDTDFIPEMHAIKADVALLPVSGVYVMTAEEAIEAANAIKPKVAVPMHYGSIVGTEEDAQRFKRLGSMRVEILERQRP